MRDKLIQALLLTGVVATCCLAQTATATLKGVVADSGGNV